MENKNLHLYSIMSFNQIEHIDEICQDIKKQYEDGVASCVLFSMPLVPEGNPPADKVGAFCKKYKLFKEKLDVIGVPNGVLVQSSMGHSRKLASPSVFQKIVGLCNGEATDTCCPYDSSFRDYLKGVMAHIASLKPDCFMVDDDTRLVARTGRGCACPLHMARFNEIADENLSREELWDIISKGGEKGRRYNDIFLETQKESMILAAKAFREGVDAVDDSIQGTLSVVGNHEAGIEMAKILAGKGNPSVLRIGSGNYTPAGARNLSKVALRTARQIACYKDNVDVILAETDTCPQNRYSTGAYSLHSHFTASIIEGASGAKHWITRLAAYEPESGKAYRRILGKNRGFYSELARIVPTLSWRGFRIPIPSDNSIDLTSLGDFEGIPNEGWTTCVLERLGLPMYFSAKKGGIACLNGNSDRELTDNEILDILHGSVFLASDTAQNLIKRGFGKYLGVDVLERKGDKAPTSEVLSVNGNRCSVQMQCKELVPDCDKTVIYSKVVHSLTSENQEYLFPGVTGYKNELGGTVFVFCGTPLAKFNYMQAFSFLNYSRKQQITQLAQSVGELPVYYSGDQEVYLRAADMEDGTLFCAVFNISLDPMDELEIVCERKIRRIEKLMPDGSKEEVAFYEKEGTYILDTHCNILDPVILFLS